MDMWRQRCSSCLELTDRSFWLWFERMWASEGAQMTPSRWTQRSWVHYNLTRLDSIWCRCQKPKWLKLSSRSLQLQDNRASLRIGSNVEASPYYKGSPKGKTKGKGKGKKVANILPAELQNKGCVGVDDHNRRLCFNFNLNKCQDAAHGAECSRGWHLCMKKGCHAPHSFLDHDKNKKPWRLERVFEMAAKGASLEDCLIVEIFAGSSRATAALKQLGLKSSFGVDKARSKNAMSTVVIADLTTPEGEETFDELAEYCPMWSEFFLLLPCGSASRARQIPLTRKFGSKRNGPRPLRTDQFPNGIPNLNPSELSRISLANQLYHVTAKLVKWAVEFGCIFVVETPQFFFGLQLFGRKLHTLPRIQFFIHVSNGGLRKKKNNVGI